MEDRRNIHEHIHELSNPTNITGFRPLESASIPQNTPVHTLAKVFAPIKIPACVAMIASDASGDR